MHHPNRLNLQGSMPQVPQHLTPPSQCAGVIIGCGLCPPGQTCAPNGTMCIPEQPECVPYNDCPNGYECGEQRLGASAVPVPHSGVGRSAVLVPRMPVLRAITKDSSTTIQAAARISNTQHRRHH